MAAIARVRAALGGPAATAGPATATTPAAGTPAATAAMLADYKDTLGVSATGAAPASGATYNLNLNGPITMPLPEPTDTVPMWYLKLWDQVRAAQSAQTAGRR